MQTPPGDTSIRPGRPGDMPAMRDAFRAAGRAAWPHILPPDALAKLDPPARWDPAAGAQVLVAERRGTVVGFVVVRRSGDDDAPADGSVGEIDGFYTAPSVCGAGVGRALLDAAVAKLAAQGFREATLWTEQRNARPLRVYARAGWRLDGARRSRTHLGAPLVELRHRRPVA